MEIYPVYLLFFTTLIVVTRLYRMSVTENDFHLKYLIFHFLFQIITMINMSMYLIFNIKIPIVIVTSGRVFSFIFFFLFLKSILDNKRARLTFIYFIPSLLLLFVDFLNSRGIKLLTFIDNQIASENILGFNTIHFVGKEDVFLILCLNTLFFTGIIFNKFFQILKSEFLTDKNKKIISDFNNQFGSVDKLSKETLEPIVNGLIKSNDTNFKGVGQPLRIALTGSKFGPGIYDIIISLGKEEVTKRLTNKKLS